MDTEQSVVNSELSDPVPSPTSNDRKRPLCESDAPVEQGEVLDQTDSFVEAKKPTPAEPELRISIVGANASSSPMVHLKFLIPSVVAGSVIGRGGDLIADVQRRTFTRMKMSRTTDFYPGTQERICLVIGELNRILEVYDYIMEKLKCRFSPTLPSGLDESGALDRTNQMLFLVPNSTAGMLIGKSGNYIRHIKDSTGAMVTIAPRNEELNERIGMVGSVDDSVRRRAFEMVLNKIAEDPLHNSFPNIAYENSMNDYQTQSNYSFDKDHYSGGGGGPSLDSSSQFTPQHPPPPPPPPNHRQQSPSAPFSNHQQMQIRQLQMQLQPTNSTPPRNSSNPLIQSGLFNLSQIINNAGGANALTADYLKLILNFIGYTDQSAIDIIRSVDTLMSYGLINNTPSMTLNSIMACLQSPTGSSTSSTTNTLSAMAAAAAASIAANSAPAPAPPSIQSYHQPPPSLPPLPPQPPSLISPIQGFSQHHHQQQQLPPIQQSAAAMTALATVVKTNGSGPNETITMQLPDYYAGSVIGTAGKGITLMQQRTGAHIHVSSRGHYVPGTTNRMVTITGTSEACSQAQDLIIEAIRVEDDRRRR